MFFFQGITQIGLILLLKLTPLMGLIKIFLKESTIDLDRTLDILLVPFSSW